MASFLAKSLSYALRERASHTLFICIIIFNLVSVLFCPFFPTWCLVCDVSIPRLSVVASHLVKTRIVRESDYSSTSALFMSCESPNAETIFERCTIRRSVKRL